MSVDLWTLQQQQYISIPGDHINFEINCKGPVPPEVSQVLVTSNLVLNEHKFIHTVLIFCHLQSYMYCLKFYKNNVEYLVYGNIRNYLNKPIDKNSHFSWLKSNKFCRKMGYGLPYFMSRDELNDLINFLHGGDKIPYLEAIFIGLRYKDDKVWVFILY